MIFVSAGMPRAGTAWFFNMTNDLVVAAGYSDARKVRDRYQLQSLLRYDNCNVGALSIRRLGRLLPPHWRGETFVVKTHHGPGVGYRLFRRLGIARAAYIYRDPRDAAISRFKMGIRMRAGGSTAAFASERSIEDSLRATQAAVLNWEAWARRSEALVVRYEDLVADAASQMRRVADHFRLQVPDDRVEQVVALYAGGAGDAAIVGRSHFISGIVGAHRDALTAEQRQLADQLFGVHLERMGYER